MSFSYLVRLAHRRPWLLRQIVNVETARKAIRAAHAEDRHGGPAVFLSDADLRARMEAKRCLS